MGMCSVTNWGYGKGGYKICQQSKAVDMPGPGLSVFPDEASTCHCNSLDKIMTLVYMALTRKCA